MILSDNPVKDAERIQWERDNRIYDLPECNECGQKIMEDHYYDIDGVTICPDCMRNHKVWIW